MYVWGREAAAGAHTGEAYLSPTSVRLIGGAQTEAQETPVICVKAPTLSFQCRHTRPVTSRTRQSSRKPFPGSHSATDDLAGGRVLLGDGAWIGYVNLVPIVIAFGEEPVIPQLCEPITEATVPAHACRMMSPSPEEAVLP